MPEAAIDDAADDTGRVSELLAAAERGELREGQADALFAALYRELHRLARRELHRGAGPVTLSATTLLHEAYLDLRSRGSVFPDRGRFFAYAARAMRGLIVDHVRQRRAIKRGAEFQFTSTARFSAPRRHRRRRCCATSSISTRRRSASSRRRH